MNNGEMTPKVALEVLQKLGSMESLRMNLSDHMLVQEALKVFRSLIPKEEVSPDKPGDLKVV